MKRPGRKRRAKKTRLRRGKPANPRKGVNVAKRKRQAKKKATRKHVSRAQPQLNWRVPAIVNGGQRVGPGGDDD